MPCTVPHRHIPRRHLRPHRPRQRGADRRDVRTSDLVLAVLGVVLLGGFCLLLAGSLIGHALAP